MNGREASTPAADNPVLVEVWRGEFLESRHRGAFVVCDSSGAPVLEAGDVERQVYPRSSLKPLQALPLLETGAAARFGLNGGHVCLACASHKGEEAHVRRVRDWLGAIGLDEGDLECGAHRPYSVSASDALVREAIAPSRLHNNCSGKHAGFLTVARHLGIDHHGYIEPGHEIQNRVTQVVEETCESVLSTQTPGVDGCGIPVYGIPLRKLAAAFARFAPSAREAGVRGRARGEIVDAIVANPYLIGGEADFCTRVIALEPGTVIVKTGAEGVFAGTLLKEGLGFALKIDDGASRASEVVTAALLGKFTRNDKLGSMLAGEVDVAVRNAAGRIVGRITPVSIAAF